MVEKSNWLPLESNPEIINKYVAGLGLDLTKFTFNDLFSCDDWAQDMIPQPCKAVLLLFPIKDCVKDYEKKEKENIIQNGQTLSKQVYFMKQFAANACGTVGIFHAIMNNLEEYPDSIQKDCFFQRFAQETKDQTGEERGRYFEKNSELKVAHKEAVQEGKSEIKEDVITHFICFVEKEGCIYEVYFIIDQQLQQLDGRKDFPINHGKMESGNLLQNSCRIVKEVFMNRDPDELRFTLMAFAKAN